MQRILAIDIHLTNTKVYMCPDSSCSITTADDDNTVTLGSIDIELIANIQYIIRKHNELEARKRNGENNTGR